MRWSQSFIPTLRDNPSDADSPAHRLLLRAGFVRQPAAGVCTLLPLGQRTMRRIMSIVREELSSLGAQEFQLPALHTADPRPETAKDRTGRELPSGMTHEEAFTEIARKEIRSYKDLPQIWYRIQTKFRDEVRPKSGFLRLRQFIMQDSCSFDIDSQGLERSCRNHHDAYCRILSRCGLEFVTTEAGSGAMGENQSQEFMVRTESGEEMIATCSCGYVANLETAASKSEKIEDLPSHGEPRAVHTPNRKTIAEIAEFLNVPPTHQVKSLVYMKEDTPCLFLVRGDRQLSETKAMAALLGSQVRPAQPDEIRAVFGADAGSLGPVGVENAAVYADRELEGRMNLTCGANRNDYHLQGVTPGLHFKPIWADLRTVESGEACVRCGSPLVIEKAAKVAHIARLGTRYSEATGALALTAEGRQTPLAIGSYGIELDRIMYSAVEQHHDADGIIWPAAMAPYSVVITPVIYRDETRAAADKLYAALLSAGVDALLDDRAERPGVKFKDADLIGIPHRIVLGTERLKQGKVELYDRAGKRADLVGLDLVVSALAGRLASSPF